MEATQALADLVEISAQIESAVLGSADGTVLGSTIADAERSEAVVREALALLEAAHGPAGEPTQAEATFPDGSFFVVRDDERLVAAVTGRDPTVGLVFYDLKTCLRLAGEAPEKPAKAAAAGGRRRKKKVDEEGAAGDGEA